MTEPDPESIAPSSPAPRCSFCGGSDFAAGDLVEGGGPHAGGLPVVHICRDCVEACMEALTVERRVSADDWPAPDVIEPPAPIVSEWTDEAEITSQVRLPKPAKET
ncbi:MAG: ClpX C4-type zinc finger protein [Polyangiaceae bacterium]